MERKVGDADSDNQRKVTPQAAWAALGTRNSSPRIPIKNRTGKKYLAIKVGRQGGESYLQRK